MARAGSVVVVLSLVAVLVGCTPREPRSTVAPLTIPAGCSPLLHEIACGLPYPSDHFLVDDDSLPSGHRVEIEGAAELSTQEGRSADATDFMPQDGFSRLSPVVWTFGVPVDDTTLPGINDDPAATLEPGFPIALIDASDGSRVAFFVDVDPRATDPAREALILRPLVRMKAETRYVVVVSGVVGVDGVVPVPVAMQRLLAGADAVGDDRVLRPLSARYESEIFPYLVDAGIERMAVQLAWDFTTGSDAHVSHDMLRARSLALEALATSPPTAVISRFLQDDQLVRVFSESPGLSWRYVELRVTGPRVVETDEAGTLLARDEDGDVAINGTTTFKVTAVLPVSVRDVDDAAPVELYGHGFFGGQNEVQYANIRELSQRSGRVLFAIDWLGMSLEDLGVVAGSMGSATSEALRFGERVPQGMVNWLTLTDLIKRGGLNHLVTVVGGTTEVTPFRRAGGSAVVDGGDIAFVGMSQGHILGGIQVALNADVKRAVLIVGGAGFSHMMFRARPFLGFTTFLDMSVPDPLDQQLLTAQLQRAFDRFDPGTYAPWVLAEELPEGPTSNPSSRRVLIQSGRGDTQVPNLGAILHMRALGVSWILPGAFDAPWGLPTTTAPFEGSGAYMYDFGIDASFEEEATFPDDENRVHSVTGATRQSQEQGTAFLRDGVIINPCDPDACGVLR